MDELPKDVLVSASWYGCRDSTRCLFQFDATVDKTLYSLEHFIGSPCLEYDARTKLFHLENPTETLAALDAALLQTAPARPGGKRTHGEEAEAFERKRLRQSADWDPAPKPTSGARERSERAVRMAASVRKK